MSDAQPILATTLTPGPLNAIGRAIEARLATVFPATRFHYDVMPPRITQAAWKTLVRRTPFVSLGWRGVQAAPEAARLFKGVSQWSVFLVARNQGSISGRYFGDAQGYGLLTMAQVAIAALHGWTLPGFGSCLVTDVSNAAVEGWEDEAALAVVDLAIGTTIGIADVLGPPEELGEFLELQNVWNLIDNQQGGSDELTEMNEVRQ